MNRSSPGSLKEVTCVANKAIMQIIKEYGSKFKVAFSISGIALDQFEIYAPEVIESFQKLAKTGSVEFLC